MTLVEIHSYDNISGQPYDGSFSLSTTIPAGTATIKHAHIDDGDIPFLFGVYRDLYFTRISTGVSYTITVAELSDDTAATVIAAIQTAFATTPVTAVVTYSAANRQYTVTPSENITVHWDQSSIRYAFDKTGTETNVASFLVNDVYLVSRPHFLWFSFDFATSNLVSTNPVNNTADFPIACQDAIQPNISFNIGASVSNVQIQVRRRNIPAALPLVLPYTIVLQIN